MSYNEHPNHMPHVNSTDVDAAPADDLERRAAAFPSALTREHGQEVTVALRLIKELLAALREERERCAKIAEEHPAMESHELAAAIRKGDE